MFENKKKRALQLLCVSGVRLALTDRDHTHPIGAFEPFRGDILVLLIPCGVPSSLSRNYIINQRSQV